jgi:hypothetical protein
MSENTSTQWSRPKHRLKESFATEQRVCAVMLAFCPSPAVVAFWDGSVSERRENHAQRS